MLPDEALKLAERRRTEGDGADARRLYEQAAHDARARFDPALEAKATFGLAELARIDGDEDAAEASYEAAIARAMEGGEPLVEADAHFGLALLAFDRGQSKDGHDALLEAMALYRDLGGEAKPRLARALRLYGEHLGVLGSTPEARQAFEIARAMFRDLGDDLAARGIDEDLAHLAEYAR